MTGKHHNWHRAWSRLPNGNLRHDTGLVFVVSRGASYTDIEADPSTLDAFQAAEQARGVPFHDLVARMKRLAREAAMWHESNP